jgi:DNA-binding response OmpR family regulator
MNDKPRVLLVDDEDAIRDGLAPFLSRSGFEVRTASDGVEALETLRAEAADIVVCDIMMPRMDGREVVRTLRADGDWTPVILLTQVGASFERSAALEEGADDYLNKPFDPQELLARLRAVLRRSVKGQPSLAASTRLQSGPLTFDRSARRIWLDGVEVYLTPKASLLLEYLMSHPDELHTRPQLLEQLWGFERGMSSRAVDHRVAEIRRVLGDDPASPRFVETVTSLGYRFVGRVDRPTS